MKARIQELDLQIKELQKEKAELEQADEAYRSREFIRVNNIKRRDVQCAKDPWFWTLNEFVAWQRSRLPDVKLYSEWNGWIYNTLDLANGKFEHTPARYDDIRE